VFQLHLTHSLEHQKTSYPLSLLLGDTVSFHIVETPEFKHVIDLNGIKVPHVSRRHGGMSALLQKHATAAQASDFPKQVTQVTQVIQMPAGILLDG